MNKYQSKYIRIVDKYVCLADMKTIINKLETELKVDLKSLSQWEEIVMKMSGVKSDCKKKLLDSRKRRLKIIDKLYIENYRVSPFKITEKFGRTANLWKNIKQNNIKKSKKTLHAIPSTISVQDTRIDDVFLSEESEIKSNAHPNSEDMQAKDPVALKREVELDINLNETPHLPPAICINQHKMLSPLESDNTFLSLKENSNMIKYDTELVKDKNYVLNQLKLVKCLPEKLVITENTFKRQCLHFSLRNCSIEPVFIRFKSISDSSFFSMLKIVPDIPFKLNPGLAMNFKLIFMLRGDEEKDISLILYYKIGQKILQNIVEEILEIPVFSKSDRMNLVKATETVKIPPVYSWQISAKFGFPKGFAEIQIKDNRDYNLYIRKKIIDFDQRSDENKSIEVISPDTESLMQKIDNNEFETQEKTLVTPKIVLTNTQVIENRVPTLDIVELVYNDILNLVFDTFVFKSTYLRLSKKSKRIVFVYFTKANHIGYHQSYYDLIFCDPKNDETVFVKTIKVFAEVMPHPIVIHPKILDITKSRVTFGYYEDHITISNKHKIYSVTIKIKTTIKTDKLIKISPKEVCIPAKSSTKIDVKVCTTKTNYAEYLAYFVVKIKISGHKSIYKNVPPIFYELIVPCGKEFIENEIKIFDQNMHDEIISSNT